MTQAEALKIMASGANVFLTGAPGAGKTFILNKFIEDAEKRRLRLAITASTGIAASHINGVTIHSWSGLGLSEQITPAELEKMKYNDRILTRISRAQILVIDEVSMLHGKRLNMVNAVCKALRKNDRAFGGLQVILVGDLFQLPPVTPGNVEIDFVHRSQAWAEINPRICYVTEQHRQETSDGLLELLIAMRRGNILNRHYELLQGRKIKPSGDVTRLFTHNVDVDTLNQAELNKIKGETKTFLMTSSGNPYKITTLKKNVLAPEKLELKVGAEVMFVANDFEAGYVNGTRGKIVRFSEAGNPVVILPDGEELGITPHTWSTKDENGRVEAEVEQVPLRLAWAITVHKSQGMSLDAAEVDLTKAFTPGMGYVALSRVRSLEGLYLTGFNDKSLQMHEEIYTFDNYLREASG
jgi:ATP-dependent exoDNAse (exonuclease V) alpha subunit